MIQPKFFSDNPGYVSQISEQAKQSGAIDLADNSFVEDLPPILSLLIKHLSPKELNNPFSPLHGLISLREIISEKIERLYGHKYSPEEEITITCGPNQALFAAMSATLKEGDEVLLLEPANENYLPVILLCGARPVYVPLKDPDFIVDWEEVTKMVTVNTKMIIINTPNNPTGMVFTELDMLRLQKLISGTNIIVLSDERYEHIIFDNESHQSVALYPKLAEISIIINSLSISCRAPWPIGYCAAPSQIMKRIRQILEVTGSRQFTPFQTILTEALSNQEAYKSLRSYYQEKRNYFNEQILIHTGLKPLISKGSFFQLLNYGEISKLPNLEFATLLLEEIGVAVAPYNLFVHEKIHKPLIRINFSRPKEILDQAIEKLSKL